ncbi:MAG: hemin-degrading factor [Rhodobacteraceae bacterium]|nr:hemin-degrading factor [Paracoccaceae bacterium]MAY45017.1 hemin-degrading factor [Paracoccaceae bacterium]
MNDTPPLNPARIRARAADITDMRAREKADHLGIAEAQLVAAYVGHGTTAIAAHPDAIMPALTALGEVMALTRNDSCVIEKVGVYDNYRSGEHAGMVLNDAIDLRMFPSHWVSAFAVETQTDSGIRRSVQVFDAAGDAVHKVHLRDGSNLDGWATLVDTLKLDDQSDALSVDPRKPTEVPKSNPEKLDILRAEWARMTDTHQFNRLTSKLKMNRLGAYRIAGAPWVRPVAPDAIATALQAVSAQGAEIMVFVGNRGCIEIHGGPCDTIKVMGPWFNVLDAGFNLHLRADHLAEVWAVTKPTQRGDAVSLEGFDADGGLILQIFGRRSDAQESRPAWNAIVDAIPSLETETA